MFSRFPKDDHTFTWTRHIKNKMMFYGLSESRIRAVLREPKRVEEGIAPRTTAAMRRNDKNKKKEEIWIMYQKATNKRKLGGPKILMISAWRYPGVSKAGAPIPIPEDIVAELNSSEEVGSG